MNSTVDEVPHPIDETDHPLESGGAKTPVGASPCRQEQARKGETATPATREALQAGGRRRSLSPRQRHLWALYQALPPSSIHHVAAASRLQGDLRRDALSKAWSTLLARHGILRASFSTDGWTEQPAAAAAGVVPEIDLEALPSLVAVELRRRLRRDFAHRVFVLERDAGPRLLLLRAGPEDHDLLLTLHGIVADARSASLLLAELGRTWAGEAKQAPGSGLVGPSFDTLAEAWPEPEEQALEEALAHWRSRLANPPEPLELPADRPPAAGGVERRSHPFDLEADLVARLEVIAERRRTDLYAVLLAALTVVLERLTGAGDLVLGTTVPALETPSPITAVGPLTDLLALRLGLDAGDTGETLVEQAAATVGAALAHRALPFDRVVAEVAPERLLQPAPLFQVLLAIEPHPQPRIGLPGLRETVLTAPSDTVEVPWALVLRRDGDRLSGSWDHDPRRYDATSLARWAGQLRVALEILSTSTDLPIAAWRLETPAQRHQLLVEWNHCPATGGSGLAHELFLARAREQPRALALIDGERSLTYRDLRDLVLAFAARLRARGIGPEVGVALLAERSTEMLVALLGTLVAGGFYVPLDPEAPVERLAFILGDARPHLVAGHRRLLARLPATEIERLAVDELEERGKSLDSDGDSDGGSRSLAAPRGAAVVPDNLLTVLFTSGTTGRPKGVALAHEGIVNRLLWSQRSFPTNAADRILVKTPWTFDVSMWESLGGLAAGACLVLAEPAGHRDPAYLARIIAAHRVTLAHFVPSMLRAFVETPGFEQCTSLRAILTSGEVLGPELASAFQQKLPVPIHNLYGPTEASIEVTHWRSDPGAEHHHVPLGRPLPRVDVFVTDPRLRLRPYGTSGELLLAGAALARGYWRRPGLTAERFVPDPWSGRPGTRLYRSGDLGRWRCAGVLSFHGRLDFQVKLRGQRVELGEIERVLAAHPQVADAVVVTSGEGPEIRLVAFVIPRSRRLRVEALASHLRAKLPAVMVPARLSLVDAFPTTSSGKVDRQALGLRKVPEASRQRPPAPPRSPRETLLVELWEELLGVDPVGVEDDFFLTGGDSLLAVQMVQRALAAGIEITPKQVFEQRTIARLAALGDAAREPPTLDVASSDTFPLTPIQRWFFDLQLEEPNHWNVGSVATARPELDLRRVEEVLATLARHHDALRLRFADLGDPAARTQTLAPPGARVPFAVVDLARLAPEDREPERKRILQRLHRSLDLGSGPLVRVLLLRRSPGETASLVFLLHHLIADGLSLEVLVEDFRTSYQQLEIGQTARLPAAGPTYRQWAAGLATLAATPEARREARYWLRQPWHRAAPLPLDHPGAPGLEGDTRAVIVALDTARCRQLTSPGVGGQPLHVLLTAALAHALERWSGCPWISLALLLHGRVELGPMPAPARTVGWFNSLFPILLEVPSDPPAVAAAIAAQLRRVPRGGLSFGVSRYSSPDPHLRRSLAALPEPAVTFNFVGRRSRARGGAAPGSGLLAPSGESLGRPFSPRNHRPHLLRVSATAGPEGLHVGFRYSCRQFRRSTIERVADTFLLFLGSRTRPPGGKDLP